MSKKLIIVVGTLLLLAITVPSAYAAINDQQKSDLKSLYQKMIDIRKQMIDIYVSDGQITPVQGKIMKDNLDKEQKNIDENVITPGIGGCGGDSGSGMMGDTTGTGMMGSGSGMMGGTAGTGMMGSRTAKEL
ncbi:MAG: DUF2680 domain-containing protein [Bacillota bacterium]